MIDMLMFAGRGVQGDAPVITFQGSLILVMRVGGKNARNFRVKMATILRRYYAGDLSLIPELQHNAASEDPIAEMARDSLRNDPILSAKIPDPVQEARPVENASMEDDSEGLPDQAEAPAQEKEDRGPGLGEKRPVDLDDVDRELEREERRLRLVERKKALERQEIEITERKKALEWQEIDHVLETYKMVKSDEKFDHEVMAAVKERTLKIVKGVGSDGADV
jgi:hypothetical protein